MRVLRATAVLLFVSTAATPHDPITTNLTWTKEISRVVYRRCASCHRPDGAAFSLLTYQEARPWAKGIRDEVLSRRMPPWDAVKGVGEFRGDISLSLPEIDLIVAWVEGGAPEGDSVYLPAPPKPEPPADSESRAVAELQAGTVLKTPLTLQGIRPSGPTEVTALLPGGAVRRLLWIRDFHPAWNRTYWLRKPERLPAGTRIRITGAAITVF